MLRFYDCTLTTVIPQRSGYLPECPFAVGLSIFGSEQRLNYG